MSDPTTLSPADLGAAYAALEDDNRHHDTAILVARAAGDEAAINRLTEIKAAWEAGEDWCSRERYDISQPIFKALRASGRLIYPPVG